ncbi:MAG: glycosyltransferase family 2 protein [Gemmatimonadaceae bacterium]
MTARISVVLTAHNASGTLTRCLDSLKEQEGWDDGAMEVIVVDDRSTDGTSEVARGRGLSSLAVVRLSEYTDPTLTARQVALDAGIRRAGGDVVLLLDADARVAPDWSAALAAPVVHGTADLVAGGVAFDPQTPGWKARAVASLQ